MEIKKSEKKAEKPDARTYVVLKGINYKTPTGEKRAEVGDRVSDLPARSVRWLVEDGAIREDKDA